MKYIVFYEYDSTKPIKDNIESLNKYKKFPHDNFCIRFNIFDKNISEFIMHLNRNKDYYKLSFIDYHIDDEFDVKKIIKNWNKDDIIFEYQSFDRFNYYPNQETIEMLIKYMDENPNAIFPEIDEETGKPIIPSEYAKEWD